MSFGDAISDDEGGDSDDRQPADPAEDLKSRDALLMRRNDCTSPDCGAGRSSGGRGLVDGLGGLWNSRRNACDRLQFLQDRIVAGHELLAIGQTIRPAVPSLHAAKEVVGVGKAVEVLPRPEGGADFGL